MLNWRAGLFVCVVLHVVACAASDGGEGTGDLGAVADDGVGPDLGSLTDGGDLISPVSDADSRDGGRSDGPGPPDAASPDTGSSHDALSEGDDPGDAADPDLWWDCPTAQLVRTDRPGGELLSTTTYHYDQQNRPLGYTQTDAEGAVTAASVATWQDDFHRTDELDSPYDGQTDVRYVYTYDRDHRFAVVDTLLLTRDDPDVRARYDYVDGAEPGTTAFGSAERVEFDTGIDGSVDQLSVNVFSSGRLVRSQYDRYELEYDNGTPPHMDGTWDWVETYEYGNNRVTVSSDGGGARCTSETCTAYQPDGEPDRITQLVFGSNGDPDLLYSGRPIEQRYDWEADDVVDHVTYLTYDEDGRLRWSESDADADGEREQRTTYTYLCD